jgi:hypothetical protein
MGRTKTCDSFARARSSTSAASRISSAGATRSSIASVHHRLGSNDAHVTRRRRERIVCVFVSKSEAREEEEEEEEEEVEDVDDDDDEVLKERRSPRERGRMGTSGDEAEASDDDDLRRATNCDANRATPSTRPRSDASASSGTRDGNRARIFESSSPSFCPRRSSKTKT